MDEHQARVIPVTQELLDGLAQDAFGRTRAQAHEFGVCISCGRTPVFTTVAGEREYQLSGLCEPCFDQLFPPQDDDENG